MRLTPRPHLFLAGMMPLLLALSIGSEARMEGAVPSVLNHSGFVRADGIPFDGAGQFKFALVDAAGTTSYWSNDGTSAGGAAPTAAVPLTCTKGLYQAGLGDTTLTGMTEPVTPDVFSSTDVHLRVWFNDGVNGWQLLSPDQPILSVGYAMQAAQSVEAAGVADGSIDLDALDTSSVDARYVEVAGDTMTGPLTAPAVTITDDLTVNDVSLLKGPVGVGLGAGTPAVGVQLHARGNIEVQRLQAALNPLLSFYDDGGTYKGWLQAFGSDFYVANNQLGNMYFRTSGSDRMRIDAAGDVFMNNDLSVSGVATLPSIAGGATVLGVATVNDDLKVGGQLGVGLGADPIDAVSQVHIRGGTTLLRLQAASNPLVTFYDNAATPVYKAWLQAFGDDFYVANRLNGYLRFRTQNSDRMVIDGAGNVGIGDATPYTKLTMNGPIGWQNNGDPMMYMYESGVSNPDRAVLAHSPGFPGWGMFYEDTNDRFYITSNGSADPALMVSVGGDWVTINTDTPAAGYELSVDGQIACEELLVQDSASWPDYVFEEDYDLMPLDALETSIRENKRLPGVPSAEEVAQTGISVGAMQKRMMEKIEELTLYVIDQNKELQEAKAEIRQLREELATLR